MRFPPVSYGTDIGGDYSLEYDYYWKYLNSPYYGVYDPSNESDGEMIIYKNFLEEKKDVPDFLDLIKKYYSDTIYDADHILSLDYPQTADITIHRKAGDCEDFARLGCVILSAYGYKPYIIIMLGINDTGQMIGHAACYVKIDNFHYVFDISGYFKADDLSKILSSYSVLSNYERFYKYGFDISQNVENRIVKLNQDEGIIKFEKTIPAVLVPYNKVSTTIQNKTILSLISIVVALIVVVFALRR